jgi:hypothetical protein
MRLNFEQHHRRIVVGKYMDHHSDICENHRQNDKEEKTKEKK